ncbi:hypothetical protein LTR28_003747, partial [Elasticomyces elasticus]
MDGIDVNLKDEDGQTPLSLAAERGHEAVVKPLVVTLTVPESKVFAGDSLPINGTSI